MAGTRVLCTVVWLAATAAAAAAVDCIKAPSNPACAGFKLPAAAATEDLNLICKGTPQLSGCSLFKACSVAKPAQVGSTPGICEPFRILATICTKDPLARYLPGCQARYNAMCAVPGSVVKQCKEERGFPLVTSVEANKMVRSICGEMDMDGCSRCTPAYKAGKVWGGPACDPFAVLGWLCGQMPDMPQCTGAGRWDQMCKQMPGLYACVGNSIALTDKAWRWGR